MTLSRRGRSRGLRAASTITVMLAIGTLVSTQASASPRPSVQTVARRVQQLRQQAELATERYDGAREQIASLTIQVAAARAKVADDQQALNAARVALGKIAADTYEQGDLATLNLFLGDDPDSFIAANGLMVSLGSRRADVVADLLQQRQDLAASMTDQQVQQGRLQSAQQQLLADRVTVQRELAEATAQLDRLTGGQRAALTAGQNAQDDASLGDLGIVVPPSGRPSCDDVPVVAPDARTGRMLAYACAQLGAPYVWAGAGPRDFDCSGLTMMAWKAAGVSLPHNAAMQSTYGTPVTRDELRPGDLLFFGSPIGHVGIYIGDGAMVHAPSTGDVVRIAPVFWSDFVGAVRL